MDWQIRKFEVASWVGFVDNKRVFPHSEKGKPVVRRGRKVMGLYSSDRQTAEGIFASAVCFFNCLEEVLPEELQLWNFPYV